MQKVAVGRPRDAQRYTALANAHGAEAETNAESDSAAIGGRGGEMADVVAPRQWRSAWES
jgi:hypothetical protein